MQITLAQAINAFPALRLLAQRELSLPRAFAVSKLIDVVQNEISLHEKASQKRAGELGIDKPLAGDATEAEVAARQFLISDFRKEADVLGESVQIEIPDLKLTQADLGDKPIQPAALIGISFLFA